MAAKIKDELGFEKQSAEVRFLGVWDTVPGSSLKGCGVCKEEKGFIKKSFYWLVPGIDKGERYKTNSYPAIRQIAHAVSLDENRSKFAPLLICDAMNSKYTEISELWFPGAHSDVGGGYEDSNSLPSISLGWMIRLLDKSYKVDSLPQENGDPGGLGHWPMGDRFGNVGSECVDRQLPEDALLHASVHQRRTLSPVPIRWEGTVRHLSYPIGCKAM